MLYIINSKIHDKYECLSIYICGVDDKNVSGAKRKVDVTEAEGMNERKRIIRCVESPRYSLAGVGQC